MQRRFFSSISLLLLSLGAAVLSACGGGGGSDGGGNATLRLVNVARDFSSLDLFSSDTNKVGNPVPADAASDYSTLASGTYTLNLKRTGSSAISNTSSRNLQNDAAFTLLAYRAQDALRTAILNDGEASPTAGTTKVRVINLAVEAGSLDVFVTPKDPDVPLNDLPANFGARPTESVSTYSEITKGTYRVRVTGAGDKNDLRLDLPSVDLVDGQILSLVLTSTPGGVLVNGHTLLQKGAVSAFKNTLARVRLVAGVPANGGVAARINGTVLSTGLASPTVDLYKLVPIGATTLSVSVDNVPVTTDAAATLTSGSDWTLAVVGDAVNRKVVLLADNNSTPLNSAKANIRLFNGVNGLTTSAALKVNSRTLVTEVAFGTASGVSSVDPGQNNVLLEVTSPTAPGGSIYKATEATLLAGKVYTLFVLGASTDANNGQLSLDR